MHERFVSSIYSQNLTQYTMGTNKPGRRNRCHVNVPTRNKLDLFGSTASLGVWRGIGQREAVLYVGRRLKIRENARTS